MRTLDETDREILRLLLADARRPFSEIAEHVDLSGPAVSDRVERLLEVGVIEGFTLRVDDRKLAAGLDALVTLGVPPAEATGVHEELAGHEGVEHAFLTADGEVVCTLRAPADGVRTLLDDAVGLERLTNVDVQVVERHDWTPALGDADLAVDCVVCGNAVTAEGESARIDGTLYHFCCDSCQGQFERRYERLEEGA
ncbi:AsnC family transcriptional regulator [Halorubrum gandharaense]